MKKITFFLSLLLTVVGITTTQAQTLLKLSDITDGRVITLKGCSQNYSGYMKGVNAGVDDFNPRETAFVVEYIESNEGEQTPQFYLKNFSSDDQYLQPPTNDNRVTLGPKEGAAVFYVISVSTSGTTAEGNLLTDSKDLLTENIDEVIRFVTIKSDNSKIYLNCGNKGEGIKYATGTGSFSVFFVYDAAELYCEEFGKNLGEPVYVGDHPVASEKQKQAMETTLEAYNSLLKTYNETSGPNSGENSEDKYESILTAYNDVLTAAESGIGEFDPNLYYLIENDYTKGTYMGVTKDNTAATPKNVLICSNEISGSASHIWQFELDDTNVENVEKYYMTSQGVYCSEPSQKNQVELSGKETSFYLINTSVGIYAFDSQVPNESSMESYGGENTGTGLQKSDEKVVGWGTKADASKWKLRYARTYNLDISSAGWASLNLPFAVELPEEESITAYYAVGETDDNMAIVLKEAGMQIPANCPVIINGPEDSYTLTILPAKTDVASPASDGNQFKGTLLPALQDGGKLIYALGDSDDGVAFCKLSDGDRTIPANKAYYEAPENVDTNGVNALRFSFGTATGIAGASASAPSASRMWFDLKGRRVLYPGKGIYVNAAGEKVLFK